MSAYFYYQLSIILFIFPLLVQAHTETELKKWGISTQLAKQSPIETAAYLQGKNPHPINYHLPQQKPLSMVAELGKQLFHDSRLSGSGQLSCVSCHQANNRYQPPTEMKNVMRGGLDGKQAGFRPPPSLRYLYRQQAFSIGPDISDQDDNYNSHLTPPPRLIKNVIKSANNTTISANNIVPQGGLFLDGRADTLQQQVNGPLMNPVEMAAPSHAWIAERLHTPTYEQAFKQLFGSTIYANPKLLIAEMAFAIARYQIEDQHEFYPFTSKYDEWLQGKVTFSPAEMRGFFAFNDEKRGNCAACHLSQPTKDKLPPLFTDQQYEALGVPRNKNIPANQDPLFYDLGLCGPFRKDLKKQLQYCGMFLTPTLRNIAKRKVFFHNARYTTLKQVLDFYNFRDTNPEKIYPKDNQGHILKYDDIPKPYQKNVDTHDPPLNRHLGDKPSMTNEDEKDIIAFLKTLTDKE